ncbi:DUF2953 domain-containing protein [Desulfitispora alkaliphila]|uniref:DUF2953 domain-containing protein n=1 Tax=Desulfitispora alkaliphila TaxID=622674 RepID=UPI003D216916
MVTLLSLVEIRVYIMHSMKEKKVVITIFLLWKLIRLKITSKFLNRVRTMLVSYSRRIAQRTDGEDVVERLRSAVKKAQELPELKILHELGKPFHLKHLLWQSRVGTGDAAETAIATGALLAGKWNLYGILIKFIKKPKEPVKLDVVPNYNSRDLSLYLDCIFAFRIGHIIITGIKVLMMLIVSRIKGGEVVGGSSNRVVNENSNGKH